MKRKCITLLQELQALIIAQIATERRAWEYLRSCALVSKEWLQEARRAFFLHRTLHVYALGDESDKKLRDLLSQDEPLCTFWPYLLDIRVVSYYPREEASADYLRLLSLCLSRASNLRTIWVHGMVYSDSLMDTISKLPATKTLTSIHIENSHFPSPKELDLFIALFPQLHVKCWLNEIRIRRVKWDGTLYVPSPPPSLQFSINISICRESDLGLILNHQWNIADLHLGVDAKYIDFNIVTAVLKHIGASLESLSLNMSFTPVQGLLPLSLSRNTSLRSFHIQGLAQFYRKCPILQLTWLEPVLNTIESRQSFQDFKVFMYADKNYNPDDKVRKWLADFDWAPVEEAILDIGRFPGEPTLTMVLSGGFKWIWPLPGSFIKEDCLPRLANARRLMVAYGSDGKAELVE